MILEQRARSVHGDVPFYRADPSRDRATGGAGLGLAIVRRLAEAQSGRATAASAGDGKGATFTIELGAPVH